LQLTFARHELGGAPLDVGFASRQQLLGIGTVRLVHQPTLAPKAQAATSDSFLRGAGRQIRFPPLNFQLASRNLTGALAQRSFQLFELRELLRPQTLALRRKVPCEPE
jgi:hypothetical protein